MCKNQHFYNELCLIKRHLIHPEKTNREKEKLLFCVHALGGQSDVDKSCQEN